MIEKLTRLTEELNKEVRELQQALLEATANDRYAVELAVKKNLERGNFLQLVPPALADSLQKHASSAKLLADLAAVCDLLNEAMSGTAAVTTQETQKKRTRARPENPAAWGERSKQVLDYLRAHEGKPIVYRQAFKELGIGSKQFHCALFYLKSKGRVLCDSASRRAGVFRVAA